MPTATMPVTGDPAADQFLVSDPLALVIGMLLDQQVPMEWAFRGPSTLRDRLGRLDCAAIAAMPVDDLEAVFKEKPALHRYPGSMAKRTHALCEHVVEEYGGDAASLWSTVETGKELMRRVQALPGFGKQKAQIFVALLGKQLAVRPPGWQEVAGHYADDGSYRSVADVVDAASLEKVRQFKRDAKAAAKARGQS